MTKKDENAVKAMRELVRNFNELYGKIIDVTDEVNEKCVLATFGLGIPFDAKTRIAALKKFAEGLHSAAHEMNEFLSFDKDLNDFIS